MSVRWHRKVRSTPEGDYGALTEAVLDAVEWFEEEYETARDQVKPKGRLTTIASQLPSWIEYYYGIFQEIEGIFKHVEILIDKETQIARKSFIEHYNRDLNINQVEKYAGSSEIVLSLRMLLNNVGVIRGKYAGLHKSFEALHFQLTNVVKLHAAGIEDAEL